MSERHDSGSCDPRRICVGGCAAAKAGGPSCVDVCERTRAGARKDPFTALEAARAVFDLQFRIGILQTGAANKQRWEDGVFSDEEHAEGKRELAEAEDQLIDAEGALTTFLSSPTGYPMTAEELRAAYGAPDACPQTTTDRQRKALEGLLAAQKEYDAAFGPDAQQARPKLTPKACPNCGGEGRTRDYAHYGEDAAWQACWACHGTCEIDIGKPWPPGAEFVDEGGRFYDAQANPLPAEVTT